MGLNSALAIAGSALEIFSTGIHVSSNNIANAQTPGFVREELLIETSPPFQKGGLILGTGARIAGIVQSIDDFLETRVHGANSDFQAADARNAIYKQLEGLVGELGVGDLSTSLNQFLSSLQDVINQPESAPLRQLAVEQGAQFARDILTLRSRVDDLRSTQTVKVNELVAEANDLINQIATLNPQIAKSEASGLLKSEAGALRSLRLTAMNRLAEIVPVRFQERGDGGVDIFSGTDFLILSGQVQQLQIQTSFDRGVVISNIQLSITGSPIAVSGGGELAGIISGRDQILGGFVDELNAYTSNFIFEFNRIHTSGEGFAGFSTLSSEERISDPTAVLNNAGLSFTPTHGSFELKVTNTLSNTTTTTTISIDLDGIGTDTTLNSLQAALNGVGNITASITTNGRLKIDADPNFEFRFADDTSGALAALGINSFFTGGDSSDIAVNARVTSDHRLFAVSQGGGPSDGRNAIELVGVTEKPLAALKGLTLDEKYLQIVTDIARSSSSAGALADGLGAFRDSLFNQRVQFSGVSIDEEMIKLLEFQHAYQAAARVISAVDELFTVLLTM